MDNDVNRAIAKQEKAIADRNDAERLIKNSFNGFLNEPDNDRLQELLWHAKVLCARHRVLRLATQELSAEVDKE